MTETECYIHIKGATFDRIQTILDTYESNRLSEKEKPIKPVDPSKPASLKVRKVRQRLPKAVVINVTDHVNVLIGQFNKDKK